jgi:hypothetical protein
MATFKGGGRTWEILINVGTLRRVRDGALKIDLLTVLDKDGTLAGQLSGDPILFGDVLWELCEPQATGVRIDRAAFDAMLYGDALGDAFDAMLSALVDFSPRPQARESMRKVLGASQAHLAKTLTERAAEVDREIASLQSPGISSTTPPVS